jgi:hypothetical protein
MSEPSEVYVVMNADTMGLSVAIRLPVRPDGALPYLLAEVTSEVKSMFSTGLSAMSEYQLTWDDEDTATTTDEA